MTHALCMWKDMVYPDLKENQKRIMSQRVTDMSCTCNKKCSNQSEHFLIQINWGKNELPNIASNFAFEFVVSIFSLVTSFPLSSHQKCVDVINDPWGLTASLWYNTHGSLREINNKEDGNLQWFFLFFFFQKKSCCFALYRHCSPRVWIQMLSSVWFHLP